LQNNLRRIIIITDYEGYAHTSIIQPEASPFKQNIMSPTPLKALRVRSGRRDWFLIVLLAVILHLAFFAFFRTSYLRIFLSELPGEEGASPFPELDAPFSYVQLYERTEAPVTPEKPPTMEEVIEEATFLDEIGELSTELLPIERSSGGGSPGRFGSRRTTVEPKPLFIPWPRYPKGFKGRSDSSVELLLYVNQFGVVENVKISRGLPNEELNRIAIGSARKIRFSPGMDEGVPTSMWVKLTIAFQASGN
jgi:TonB family protein